MWQAIMNCTFRQFQPFSRSISTWRTREVLAVLLCTHNTPFLSKLDMATTIADRMLTCTTLDQFYVRVVMTPGKFIILSTCSNPIGQFWKTIGLPKAWEWLYASRFACVSISSLTQTSPLEFASPCFKQRILLVNLQWKAGLLKAVGKGGSDHLRTWWSGCMNSPHVSMHNA